MTLNIKNKLLLALIALLVVMSGVQLWSSSRTQAEQARKTVDSYAQTVAAAQVNQPVAVRFGWHQLAEPNLINEAGLPASPFRTDNWTDAVNSAP